MESIIVEIVIAITGEVVDFMLPAHVRINSLLPEVVRLINQVHQELYYSPETSVLIDEKQKTALHPESTLADANVIYGQRLILA